MNYTPIKVELPTSYGHQPITVYIPQAYNEDGKYYKGIASFKDSDFDLVDGLVSIKRSDAIQHIAGFVWQDRDAQVKVDPAPKDDLDAVSKFYFEDALFDVNNKIDAKLNSYPVPPGALSAYVILANGNNGIKTISDGTKGLVGDTIVLRDSNGRIRVNNPSDFYDAVNLGTLSKLTSSSAIRDVLGYATHSTYGLMSAEDKVNLDTLSDIVGVDEDGNNNIDKLREVYALLNTFTEETDLAEILNSKITYSQMVEYVSSHGGSVDTSNFLVKMPNSGGPGAMNVVYLNGDEQRLVAASPYRTEGAETIVTRYDNNGNILVADTPATNSCAASKQYVDGRTLPSVGVSDNGAFLRVVSGKWAKSQIYSASGVYF